MADVLVRVRREGICGSWTREMRAEMAGVLDFEEQHKEDSVGLEENFPILHGISSP